MHVTLWTFLIGEEYQIDICVHSGRFTGRELSLFWPLVFTGREFNSVGLFGVNESRISSIGLQGLPVQS